MDGGKSFRYLSSATSKAGCKRNLEEKEDRGEDGVGQGGGGGRGGKASAEAVEKHSHNRYLALLFGKYRLPISFTTLPSTGRAGRNEEQQLLEEKF